MKVILKEDVPKLGSKWSVINVAPGFARNYLFPRSLAELATESNLKNLDSKQKEQEKKKDRLKVQVKETADLLSQKNFVIKAKAGEDSKLFGTITSSQIADIVKEQTQITIEKKHINLAEPIRYLGTHKVEVKLHPEINVQLSIEVVQEDS